MYVTIANYTVFQNKRNMANFCSTSYNKIVTGYLLYIAN